MVGRTADRKKKDDPDYKEEESSTSTGTSTEVVADVDNEDESVTFAPENWSAGQEERFTQTSECCYIRTCKPGKTGISKVFCRLTRVSGTPAKDAVAYCKRHYEDAEANTWAFRVQESTLASRKEFLLNTTKSQPRSTRSKSRAAKKKAIASRVTDGLRSLFPGASTETMEAISRGITENTLRVVPPNVEPTPLESKEPDRGSMNLLPVRDFQAEFLREQKEKGVTLDKSDDSDATKTVSISGDSPEKSEPLSKSLMKKSERLSKSQKKSSKFLRKMKKTVSSGFKKRSRATKSKDTEKNARSRVEDNAAALQRIELTLASLQEEMVNIRAECTEINVNVRFLKEFMLAANKVENDEDPEQPDSGFDIASFNADD